MFHHACLKSWFDNVRLSRDLTCPHCNTIITDTSEAQNNNQEHESNEVSASMEYNTPNQKLHQNQNQHTNTNNVALISCVENGIYKDTARANSDECIAPDLYQEDELSLIGAEEAKSLHIIDRSD